MRRAPLASLVVASSHLLAIASLAAPARAQDEPVKPVPYGTSQPVPYGQPAPPAPRATTASDVIYLKNGGLLRGTLVDVIPGSHARIQLETGEIATVSWGEIARVDRGGVPMTPPPAPAAPRPPPVAAPPRASVLVHIEGNGHEVVLQTDSGSGWDRVCSAACDKWLPLDASYRIVGDGIRASKSFELHAEAGDRVILDVNAGSTGVFVLGIVGTSVGGASILIGALVFLVGAVANTGCSLSASSSSGTSGGCTSSGGGGAETAGGTMMLVGLGLGVAGIVATATNAHSSVSQEVQEPVNRAAPRNDAWLRLPVWSEGSRAPAGASIVGAPLFSTTF